MNPLRNPQKSCQLVNWAIQRVLELRANRALKQYIPQDKEIIGKFSGWTQCGECGNLYKASCKSCSSKITIAKKKNARKIH